MQDTTTAETEISHLLKELSVYYEQKDLRGILSCYTQTPRGFGSGPDEVVYDRAGLESAIRRDLSQAEKVMVTFSDVRVSSLGGAAWMMSGCRYRIVNKGALLILDGRMSVVFVREKGRWLIDQMHFSLPSATQSAGESYPGTA